ncbi:hypothetical protein [Novipirellula artificiosorum]|nr:hypothetical protein [Novipirellula artificiosorum]
MGHDTWMTIRGASGGNFQLNIMMPVMCHSVLESIHLLSNGIATG